MADYTLIYNTQDRNIYSGPGADTKPTTTIGVMCCLRQNINLILGLVLVPDG